MTTTLDRLKRLVRQQQGASPPPRTGVVPPGLPTYGRGTNPFPGRNMPDYLPGAPGEQYIEVPRFRKRGTPAQAAADQQAARRDVARKSARNDVGRTSNQYKRKGFKLARERSVPLGYKSDQLEDQGDGTYRVR